MSYDAAGNLTNDGYQTYTYDATGQQTSGGGVTQSYDGDGLRVGKVESGVATYYLRSSVLGGQVISELNGSGVFQRAYVYLGSQMLAIQQNNQVSWVHQDPVTKSQRITNASRNITSTIDLDPWGGETARSNNQAFQPHRYTTYGRDGNGSDEAMMRRYAGKWHRFVQPDPSDGSYDWTNPQSLNRYAYVKNDPVNFIDPSGLDPDGGVLGGQLAGLVNMGPGTSIVDVPFGADFGGFFGGLGGGDGGEMVEPIDPEKPLVETDPKTISSEGSKNCQFTISFESGTFYEGNRNLPNGPGNVQYKGKTYFGLGFTVSGTTRGGGGIGRIGNQVNPNNPKGNWTLDQFTSSYAKQDGEFVTINGRVQQGGQAWRDIDLTGYHFATDWTNKFTRYDHPALPVNPNTYKNQSFLIKVYNGKEYCQADFHIVQRGNTIHWGPGG